MKLLINVEGGMVQNVLIETTEGEMVRADDLKVVVWDKDTDLNTGDPLGATVIDPVWCESILIESPDAADVLSCLGF